MKIGTRVTLLTVLLVVLTLSLYGLLSVRTRLAELTADLERQTQLLGASLRVALEAALQEGLFEDIRHLVARMQATEQPIQVVLLDLVHPEESAAYPLPQKDTPPREQDSYPPPPPDSSREERLRRVRIGGQPYGEHLELEGRPVYAYMVPLRGKRGELVAVIDLTRGEEGVRAALRQTQGDVALTVTALSVLLALLVRLTVQGSFSRPLLRLVDGVDEVTRGDYTGVLLRERNDELGLLADRFNEMTRSLRHAREELLAGADAKLQLEMRLRHSDKLATIGQLAAGLAHEIGTPLNVIGGRARSMALRADDPASVCRNADIIAAQAERITKIIQQLLDYARRKAPAKQPVDLMKVARQTLDFLEHQISAHHITATLHPFEATPRDVPLALGRAESGALPGPGAGDARAPLEEPSGEVRLPPPMSPVVLGDSDQLQQVCLNLCLNAVQAMPGGGRLDLAAAGLVRRRPGLDRAPKEAYVMLMVADTGVGIPEADKERIFEPFYSTKGGKVDQGGPGGAEGQGSGLGLSVSSGIVKDHDGWIEIQGAAGGGTIFRLFFPAAEIATQDELLS